MYHSDPGHGWLEVKSALIPDDLRATISNCSYEKPGTGTAFLECDDDAFKFINYYKKIGITFDICNIHTDKQHYCRNWPQFKGKGR